MLYAPYIIQIVCECCMLHTLYRECVSVVCSIHYTESVVCSIHYTESVVNVCSIHYTESV